MRLVSASSIFAAAGIAVSACSGGGGSGSPPPAPPANASPSITSPSSVTVPENTAGVAYTISASDPDGDAITLSISGADANRFNLSASNGEIRFAAAPDFEAPADSNSDNVYEITVTASDGRSGTASRGVSITVSNTPDQRYTEEIFSGVDVQRNVTFAPGLTMDIFSPSGDTATDRPVMIAASGGGFVRQDPSEVEYIARAFARRGYVSATINYTVLGSFSPTSDELAVGGLRAVHDLFASVRFLRADASAGNQYGIRRDAFFASGESAGGVMSMIAATLDPTDAVSLPSVRNYLDNNGGVYGTIGDNDGASSVIQGAMPMSGAVLDLSWVDANSAPLFAAHEELDPVVPCDTGPEGSANSGLVVSGSCDVLNAYQARLLPGEIYLVAGSTAHVGYSSSQREEIIQEAAELFLAEVISN